MAEKLILVVEDSPTNRMVVVSACEQAGYRVIAAVDGEEALRMAAEHKPDLILLDVILPNKNGFQVCRQIKNTAGLQETKIIMVTSKSQESDRYWAKKQGADDYLTKPFAEEELLALIQRYL